MEKIKKKKKNGKDNKCVIHSSCVKTTDQSAIMLSMLIRGSVVGNVTFNVLPVQIHTTECKV